MGRGGLWAVGGVHRRRAHPLLTLVLLSFVAHVPSPRETHQVLTPPNPSTPPTPPPHTHTSWPQIILVLTSFEVSVNVITAVTGLFAMNLMLRPGVEGQGPYWQFVVISVVCGAATIAMFGGIMAYCRIKGLI